VNLYLHLLVTMTLLLTIFILIFVTELISWIGQNVLLELVCEEQLIFVTDISIKRLMQATYEYSIPLCPKIRES
jgi:hypothetical protein